MYCPPQFCFAAVPTGGGAMQGYICARTHGQIGFLYAADLRAGKFMLRVPFQKCTTLDWAKDTLVPLVQEVGSCMLKCADASSQTCVD
eukprot:2716620-Alexandrium_andersonii.AAC.1